LCRRIEAPLAARQVWPLYLRLRAASPAVRGAFFDFGQGRALLSISPEIFLSVRGRTAETRPIKGTRRRGANPADDRALARELLESKKDRAELGPADLLRATFPAASISGAPKIRAMSVIAAEEERRRGPAMGAFGWISLNGDLDLAVAIRTAVAARGKVAYHAGCGITADSLPDL